MQALQKGESEAAVTERCGRGRNLRQADRPLKADWNKSSGRHLADIHIYIYLGITAFCANSVGFRWLLSLLAYLCPLYVPGGGGGGMWGISLGDIQNVPTRSKFAIFQDFLTFWSNALNFHSVGGGMCMLFEICEKRPFQKCMGWGGGGHSFAQRAVNGRTHRAQAML